MPEECTHNCETCNLDCDSRQSGIEKAELNPRASVKHVIGVISGKGLFCAATAATSRFSMLI